MKKILFREGTAYSDRGEQAILEGDSEIAEAWFDQAAEYWKQAIALATRKVPIEIGSKQGRALAIRWLLEASQKRPGRNS